MSNSNLKSRFNSLFQDLLDLGVTKEELAASKGKLFHSAEKPDENQAYSLWEVTDPVKGDVTALKQLLPFNIALALALKKAGADVEVSAQMPRKKVWVTVKACDEYARHIPELNPTYRPAPVHANKIIDLVMRRNGVGNGRGFYGYGEAGTGKTSMCLWMASVLGQPVVQFNCSATTEIEDLFLRQISYNGVWKTVDCALLTACKRGYWALVDELDLAPASLPPSLNDLIEGHSFSVAGLKEPVRANDQFRLFAFGNTGINCSERGNYNGRNIIDESTLSRFTVDKFDSLSEDQVAKMVKASFPEVSEEFASMTSKFFDGVDKQFEANNVPSTVSPRNILDFVELFLANKDEMAEPLVYAASVKLPIINDDTEVREAVLTELSTHFKTICPEADLSSLWEHRNSFNGMSDPDEPKEDIFAEIGL
ncbi:MAG: AAA family ATPase, partial [Succinivibrio sp.]